MNRVLYDVSSKSGKNNLKKKIEDMYQTPVLGMIPCFCDVARAEGAIIFVQEKPEHLFSKIVDKIANSIETSNSV